MKNLKKGDKVIVKEHVENSCGSGNCSSLTSEMKKEIGKTLTIEEIFPSGSYKLKGNGYVWTPCMFEGTDEKTSRKISPKETSLKEVTKKDLETLIKAILGVPDRAKFEGLFHGTPVFSDPAVGKDLVYFINNKSK